MAPVAALAQLVEHRIRNAGVRCSSHLSGTIFPMKKLNFFTECSVEKLYSWLM
jgi:hypothetical protein